eukprot:COSAG01_NODE_75242_length_197_cov_97.683673_1_plen_47_part_10
MLAMPAALGVVVSAMVRALAPASSAMGVRRSGLVLAALVRLSLTPSS